MRANEILDWRLVSNMYGVPLLVRDNDLIHLTHKRFLCEMVT